MSDILDEQRASFDWSRYGQDVVLATGAVLVAVAFLLIYVPFGLLVIGGMLIGLALVWPGGSEQ